MKIVEHTSHHLVLEDRPPKHYWWLVWLGAIGFSGISALLGWPITQGAISSVTLIATHEYSVQLECDRATQDCQLTRWRPIGSETKHLHLPHLISARVEWKRPDRRADQRPPNESDPPPSPEALPEPSPQSTPPTNRRFGNNRPQPNCQLLLILPTHELKVLREPHSSSCRILEQAAAEINQFLIVPNQTRLRLSLPGGDIFWAGVFLVILTGAALVLIPIVVVLSVARYYDRVTYCQFDRVLRSFSLSRQKSSQLTAQPADGEMPHTLSHPLDDIRAIAIEPVCAPLALWNLQVVLHNDQRVALLLLASPDRIALTQLAQEIAKFLELPHPPAS